MRFGQVLGALALFAGAAANAQDDFETIVACNTASGEMLPFHSEPGAITILIMNDGMYRWIKADNDWIDMCEIGVRCSITHADGKHTLLRRTSISETRLHIDTKGGSFTYRSEIAGNVTERAGTCRPEADPEADPEA